jgi:hypothetical protein
VKRRDFITLLGSAAAAWPFGARAQQSEHIRRIGVLSGAAASTGGAGQKNVTDFIQGLQKLGWIDGENIRIEIRWSAADPRLIEAYASDLVGLFKPDVILSVTTANLTALRRATTSIPIVFTEVSDPVAQGFVSNLSRPGGNITDFDIYYGRVIDLPDKRYIPMDPSDRLKHLKLAQDEFDRRINAAWSNVRRKSVDGVQDRSYSVDFEPGKGNGTFLVVRE